MDSLTQLVLGAAVGEAILGKKVGRKAMWWGAFAGTLPDLDVIANSFLNDLDALLFHRGYTHSLFFALPVAPLLAWIAITLHRRKKAGIPQKTAPFRNWTVMFFWCVFTHPLLDIFTNYGTQLFAPVSNMRVAFNTISIVDPIYTIPLIVAMVAVLAIKNRHRRWRWTMTALLISHIYLALTVVNKWHVDRVARANAEPGDRIFTSPALLTNLLWNVVVETEEDYKAGYYGLLDSDRTIEFITLPKNFDARNGFESQEDFKRLTTFSKGYYTLREQGDSLVYNDLRFGPSGGWTEPESDYIFAFLLHRQQEGDMSVVRKQPQMQGGRTLGKLFDRIKGK